MIGIWTCVFIGVASSNSFVLVSNQCCEFASFDQGNVLSNLLMMVGIPQVLSSATVTESFGSERRTLFRRMSFPGCSWTFILIIALHRRPITLTSVFQWFLFVEQ
jgi:hypothetical protein